MNLQTTSTEVNPIVDPLYFSAKQLFFCNLTESDLRSDSPVV